MTSMWARSWRGGDVRATLFRSVRDGWSAGFSVSHEGHPGEAGIRVLVGLWEFHVWWRR